MAMVSYCCIMLKQGTCIDDAVFPHAGTGINDGTVHHDRASTYGCMTGNISTRRNDGGQLKPKCYDLLV